MVWGDIFLFPMEISKEKWTDLDRPVILASGSPRRRELLSQMGVPFEVVVDSIEDEEQFFREYPVKDAIERLAHAKASGVAVRFPESLVLGADTVVVHNGEVLGKPKDREDARGMIEMYSGSTHQVLTCVSIECVSLNFHERVTTCTDVTFRTIEQWEINHYLDTAHYFDKAGGYGIQDEAKLFVESIAGCYFNVVGFPVASVVTLFQKYQQMKKRG